jgi:hypothetical protein
LPQGSNAAARDIAMLAASLVIFMFAAQMQGLIFKGVFLLLTLTAFVLVTWFVVFSRQERKLIQEWL